MPTDWEPWPGKTKASFDEVEFVVVTRAACAE